MLATQVRQKGATFYFIAYPARDLLDRVRFMRRFYGDGPSPEAARPAKEDDIARFVSAIERSDGAFQREISRFKVRAIQNFYKTAESQPPIPGTVLLFTQETLAFHPVSPYDNVGHLEEPREKFLIIDGQHRLAALHFYLQERPQEAAGILVPCVVFDGKSTDFATEMFVTINSTATRINKSHIVDLWEKANWTVPDRRLAAEVAGLLYGEPDSPLRYRINRLGGRSRKEKWILQAELFNELHRWLAQDHADAGRQRVTQAEAQGYYRTVRDFFKAAERVWAEAWGSKAHRITEPVTLKAMLRVCAQLAAQDGQPEDGRAARWEERLAPWAERARDFRSEGFYERFPAKGQVERVALLHRELARLIGLEPPAPGGKKRKGTAP
ncbi:MAG: DGQHR domain-containing protein [Acidobacteriota bacterium]